MSDENSDCTRHKKKELCKKGNKKECSKPNFLVVQLPRRFEVTIYSYVVPTLRSNVWSHSIHSQNVFSADSPPSIHSYWDILVVFLQEAKLFTVFRKCPLKLFPSCLISPRLLI